jgi:hypothetical protein
MPRDGGGFYQLPARNPVISGTIITPEWANPTMEDLKQEMSDSLSRSGKGGMLAALRLVSGSVALPAYSFTNEPATGRYREGPGQIVEAVDGNRVMKYDAFGVYQWEGDQNTGSWLPLTPRDALGTPFDPAPSNLDATNVQDAIQEVNDKTGGIITADSVSYDDSTVYFPAATVQIALDRIGADIPGLANDILDNADAIQLIGGPGGDVDLLTQRVTLNEQNIGNNSTQIGLNETLSEFNYDEINIVKNDVSSIKLEQITQNSDIQSNTDTLSAVYDITQVNADDISTNINSISQNASDITGNTNAIASNADNITFVFDITQTNLGKINTNSDNINTNTNQISTNKSFTEYNDGRITTNISDIAINAQDLQNFSAIFPGGVLLVANGGTGETSASGTGPIIKQDGSNLRTCTATTFNLATGNIGATVLGITTTTPDTSTRIATNAFVHNVVNASRVNAEMSHVNNLGANYMAIRNVDSGDRWQVTQWGRRTFAPTNGARASFAISYVNTEYDIAISPYVAGDQGLNTAPGIKNRWTNGVDGVAPNYLCGYVAVGEVNYSAAFAAIPLTGDRYYNKVERTEHIQQIHGPWEDTPGVVILPPGNTFWGPPLDPDEDVTYDIDNLPLARVPRVKPVEELITNILLPSGLSQGALSRAMLADNRGNTAPLIAFNAALDILIGANPYTEAQFLEQL